VLLIIYSHSQASRPHSHKLNYWYIFFKQKGTFLFLQLRGHFKIGLTMHEKKLAFSLQVWYYANVNGDSLCFLAIILREPRQIRKEAAVAL